MKTFGLFAPGAGEPFETSQGSSVEHRGDFVVVIIEPNHDDEEPAVIAEIALRPDESIREISKAGISQTFRIPTKCPVCKELSENFREHALNHIRADEAYGIETWDDLRHKANLVLLRLKGTLNLKRLTSLRQELEPNQTLILGKRLRQTKQERKARRNG